MRIAASNIGMESARRYSSSKTSRQAFQAKDFLGGMNYGSLLSEQSVADEEAGNMQTGKEKGEVGTMTTDRISELQKRIDSMRSRSKVQLRDDESKTLEEFRNYMVKYIYELLFGKKTAEELTSETENTTSLPQDYNLVPMKQVIGVSETYYEEMEETAFCVQGQVKTADGQEYSIHVDVSMTRSFQQYFREELSVVQYQQVYDPLVINLESGSARLSDQKILFDIDSDGDKESLHRLEKGSGYLALDKNGNGVIDDGSELFGTKSGDGFGDLAKYDEDGDGWIDEDDAIWDKLRIWCQNEDGTGTLYSFREKNVGAICLQNIQTQFSLTDAENAEKGYIRSSGIFLFEDGKTGTVQHLDLVQ